MKNKHTQKLGRQGGLIGGIARAQALSKERRSEIAKLAAKKRWAQTKEKETMHSWQKVLTRSDAQVETEGSKMPFLRFTKGGKASHSWFRDKLFGDAKWRSKGDFELATIQITVIFLGKDLGKRTVELDYNPSRLENHAAPPMHLHYDNATLREFEATDASGKNVEVTNDNGQYTMTIY